LFNAINVVWLEFINEHKVHKEFTEFLLWLHHINGWVFHPYMVIPFVLAVRADVLRLLLFFLFGFGLCFSVAFCRGIFLLGTLVENK
jgi:hypothetical protein